MADETANEPGRGRHSTDPGEIPAPGWRDILWRTKDQFAFDNVALVSAGLAVYTLLAIFPAIAAIAFSYYVGNFGRYNEIYASLGAIVGTLMGFGSAPSWSFSGPS